MSQKNHLFKSRARIRNFAEVNTNNKIADSMLNLINFEVENIESKILEPACGDGVFLEKILNKRLKYISKKFKGKKTQFEINSLICISTIYGIDILEDNIFMAKKTLYENYLLTYKTLFKDEVNKNFLKSIKYIFSKNLIIGDSISLKDNKGKNIIFSEWSILNKYYVKETEFEFRDLVAYQLSDDEPNLFSDLGEKAFLPKVLKNHKLKKYDKIYA